LRKMASSIGLNRADFIKLRKAVVRRNVEEVVEIVDKYGCSPSVKEQILNMLFARGSIEHVGKLVSAMGFEDEVERFRQVLQLLEGYGFENRVFFDLSVVREFEYYTGMVFEVYVPEVGVTIGAGGRYDALLEKLGVEKPSATGFALYVDLCVEALKRQGIELSKKPMKEAYVGVYQFKGVKQAITLAEKLRELGVSTTLELSVKSLEELAEASEKARFVYAVGEDILTLHEGRWRSVSLDEALELPLRR